jgi:hypothetical protein
MIKPTYFDVFTHFDRLRGPNAAYWHATCGPRNACSRPLNQVKNVPGELSCQLKDVELLTVAVPHKCFDVKIDRDISLRINGNLKNPKCVIRYHDLSLGKAEL